MNRFGALPLALTSALLLLVACSADTSPPTSTGSSEIIKAPAPPAPETGAACGDVTCGVGEACCNPSCGICTAPGFACVQVACSPPPPPPCVKTGCNGDTCADQHFTTTCDWTPDAACFTDATCERQADGKCGWTSTPELSTCLSQ